MKINKVMTAEELLKEVDKTGFAQSIIDGMKKASQNKED